MFPLVKKSTITVENIKQIKILFAHIMKSGLRNNKKLNGFILTTSIFFL